MRKYRFGCHLTDRAKGITLEYEAGLLDTNDYIKEKYNSRNKYFIDRIITHLTNLVNYSDYIIGELNDFRIAINLIGRQHNLITTKEIDDTILKLFKICGDVNGWIKNFNDIFMKPFVAPDKMRNEVNGQNNLPVSSLRYKFKQLAST